MVTSKPAVANLCDAATHVAGADYGDVLHSCDHVPNISPTPCSVKISAALSMLIEAP
jgi:hypothetical protein